jgi:hypothetical protein
MKSNISGYEAFCLLNSMRLYYIGDYDYLKYGATHRYSLETFSTRKDKFQFMRLGRMFQREEELEYFLAYGFYRNPKAWIRDFLNKELMKEFQEFVSKQKNLQAYLSEKLTHYDKESFLDLMKSGPDISPLIFKMLDKENTALHFFIILDYFYKIAESYQNLYAGDRVDWDKFYLSYKKFLPLYKNYQYFNTDQLKIILSNFTK